MRLRPPRVCPATSGARAARLHACRSHPLRMRAATARRVHGSTASPPYLHGHVQPRRRGRARRARPRKAGAPPGPPRSGSVPVRLRRLPRRRARCRHARPVPASGAPSSAASAPSSSAARCQSGAIRVARPLQHMLHPRVFAALDDGGGRRRVIARMTRTPVPPRGKPGDARAPAVRRRRAPSTPHPR